jgi:hypothetical protein
MVSVCVRQHPIALSAPSSSDQRVPMAARDNRIPKCWDQLLTAHTAPLCRQAGLPWAKLCLTAPHRIMRQSRSPSTYTARCGSGVVGQWLPPPQVNRGRQASRYSHRIVVRHATSASRNPWSVAQRFRQSVHEYDLVVERGFQTRWATTQYDYSTGNPHIRTRRVRLRSGAQWSALRVGCRSAFLGAFRCQRPDCP